MNQDMLVILCFDIVLCYGLRYVGYIVFCHCSLLYTKDVGYIVFCHCSILVYTNIDLKLRNK